MKNIRTFKSPREMRDFIYGELIVTPSIQQHPLYHALIEFIIHERAPIFFSPTESVEYAHFTPYFNFYLLREAYNNDVVKSLYYMHDFVHALFQYPLPPNSLPFSAFLRRACDIEYIASNETEALVYYRLPELRAHTFVHPILYDVLSKAVPQIPSVDFLYQTRRNWIERKISPPSFTTTPEWSRVSSTLAGYAESNSAWAKIWHDGFPRCTASQHPTRYLALTGYEAKLMSYVPTRSTKSFNQLQMANLELAYELCGLATIPNHHAQSLAVGLDGKIALSDIAHSFHDIYAGARKAA